MPLHAIYSGAFEEAHLGFSQNSRIHVRDAHRTRELKENFGFEDTKSIPYSCRNCGGTMIVADGPQVPKYFRHLSAECSGGGDESEIHYDLALGIGDVFANFPEVERVFWDGENEIQTSEGGYIQPDVTIEFKSGITIFVEVVHKHPPEQITIETLGTNMIVVRTDQIPPEDVYSGLAQATIAAEILEYHENLRLLKAGKIHPSQVEISWKPEGKRASFNRMDTQFPRFMRQNRIESKCTISYTKSYEKLKKVSPKIPQFDDLLASDRIVWEDEKSSIYEEREITEMQEVIETNVELIEPPPAKFKLLLEKYHKSQHIRDNYQDANTWPKFAELFGMNVDSPLTGVSWYQKYIWRKTKEVKRILVQKKERVEIGEEVVRVPYMKVIEKVPVTDSISAINLEKLIDQIGEIECNWELTVKSRHKGKDSRFPSFYKIWDSSFFYSTVTEMIETSIDDLTKEEIDAVKMVLHFKFHQRLGEYLESRMRFSRHILGNLAYTWTPTWGSRRKALLPFIFFEEDDFQNLKNFRRYEISRKYVNVNFDFSQETIAEITNGAFDHLAKWHTSSGDFRLAKWFLRKEGKFSLYRKFNREIIWEPNDTHELQVNPDDYEVFLENMIDKLVDSAKNTLEKSSSRANSVSLHDEISMRLNQIFAISEEDITLVRLAR